MISLTDFAQRIAEILRIPMPELVYVPQLNTATQLAAADIQEQKLIISSAAKGYDLYFAVAHELRHFWQDCHDYDLDSQCSSEKMSVTAYNLQPAELDANAFAMLVMRGTFGVTPLFNGLSPKVKRAIAERAEEIPDF